MKRVLKSIISVFVVCVCVFSLASCGIGEKSAEAKAYINDFFSAIVSEDYEKAESLLHPERPADLEPFFLNVENEVSIDFQSGIEIVRYTGFSSAAYDSTVNGSTFELSMRAKIGDEKVWITIEIVENDNGYGIYNFNLDT